MTGPYKIALCGFGKIARDHHQPTIFAHKDLALAALVDPQIAPGDNPTGAPLYPDMNTLLREGPPVDAVAFCEPPPFRFANAALAVQAGKHVFLEKPPCATLEEAHALADLAAKAGVTLFAAWHSRYAGGVAEARAWLKTRTVRAARIDWLEDVRVWHPGQDWLWRPGALGVFDPGINALSILTHIVAEPVAVVASELAFPKNRAAPIAARLALRTLSGAPIAVHFDWRQTGAQTWDLIVETDDGVFKLPPSPGLAPEYAGLYDRFVELVRTGKQDFDLSPLELVCAAFERGVPSLVEPFIE